MPNISEVNYKAAVFQTAIQGEGDGIADTGKTAFVGEPE